jgi:hypothetical protein
LNPDIGDIGNPHFIHRSQLPIFDKVGINRKTMTGVRGSHEGSPGYRSQAELLHHPPHPFLIHAIATTLQFAADTSVSVARKLFVNAFDLLAQLLILGFTPAAMLRLWFVVIAAGSQSRYLAGFRN